MVTLGSGSCQITICETNSHKRADQHVKKYITSPKMMQALICVLKNALNRTKYCLDFCAQKGARK